MIVRQLVPDQTEPWEFRLEPLETGGIVSVPAAMHGQPIDWPPESGAQDAWLAELAPTREARAAAAWFLKSRAWKRLVRVLEEQVAGERDE